jgi:hypothetical protein
MSYYHDVLEQWRHLSNGDFLNLVNDTNSVFAGI